MKIPKVLKIGGHLVKVELTDKLDKDEYGDFNVNKNLIIISKYLSQTGKEATLIHEIFHGLNSTLDHALLDSLAEQFYQVLHDNKLIK